MSVVGEYVRLKRVGATQSYTGLCPFHTEKTPSFRVHANHQFYKCFGCGQGGDVFKMSVQEIERISFYEALKQLAERSGTFASRSATEYADAGDTKLRAPCSTRCTSWRSKPSGRQPENCSRHSRPILFERRGVSPAGQSIEFGIGYAGGSGQFLVNLFQKHDFPDEQMEQSGLVMRKGGRRGLYDRFSQPADVPHSQRIRENNRLRREGSLGK